MPTLTVPHDTALVRIMSAIGAHWTTAIITGKSVPDGFAYDLEAGGVYRLTKLSDGQKEFPVSYLKAMEDGTEVVKEEQVAEMLRKK